MGRVEGTYSRVDRLPQPEASIFENGLAERLVFSVLGPRQPGRFVGRVVRDRHVLRRSSVEWSGLRSGQGTEIQL